MKKNIFAFLLSIVSIVFGQVTHAQDKSLWDYPVKPGTSEWAAFKTGEQMHNSCQIPSDVLDAISTKELVTLCLNYPLINEYVALNDERAGVNIIIRKFKGLWELSQRKDGVQKLIKVYADYPILTQVQKEVTSKDYHLPYKLPFLELVISDDIFFNRLDNNELEELRKIVVNKYTGKIQNSDVYSLYNIKMYIPDHTHPLLTTKFSVSN